MLVRREKPASEHAVTNPNISLLTLLTTDVYYSRTKKRLNIVKLKKYPVIKMKRKQLR
jgi:hypothetical protein